jgi:hypothetical protein
MPPQAQGPYQQPQGPYQQPQGPYQPPGYGAQWQQPPKKSSAGIPWAIFGIAAVVFMMMAGGVGWYIFQKSTSNIPSFIQSINIPSISVPSMPAMPSTPGAPAEPTTAAPGEQLSVAGMGQTKTLDCNDNSVSISGVSNTITITGHCTTVTVSGMQNKITMDTADSIQASGFDNTITYHSGSPDINNAGNNVVQQG